VTDLILFRDYLIYVLCWEIKIRLNLSGCGELDKFIVLDNRIDEMALFSFWIIELMKNWINLSNSGQYPKRVKLIFWKIYYWRQ
jgi:hypothetical protein